MDATMSTSACVKALTCSAVSKDRCVESVNNAWNEELAGLLVDLLLVTRHSITQQQSSLKLAAHQ